MKNLITYYRADGYPSYSETQSSKSISYPGKIFSVDFVEIPTDQILFVGDHVNTEDGILRIKERVYYPKENRYVFYCQCAYTGRKE